MYVTSHIGKKSNKQVKTSNNLQKFNVWTVFPAGGDILIFHHCPLFAPLSSLTTRDWAVSVKKNPPINTRKYRPNKAKTIAFLNGQTPFLILALYYSFIMECFLEDSSHVEWSAKCIHQWTIYTEEFTIIVFTSVKKQK